MIKVCSQNCISQGKLGIFISPVLQILTVSSDHVQGSPRVYGSNYLGVICSNFPVCTNIQLEVVMPLKI